MSIGNPYYINTYQDKNIKYSVDHTFNSDTDLLVTGIRSTLIDGNVEASSTGVTDTLKNRVKAWVYSTLGDFDPNDPTKGGCIISLLGNNNIFNANYAANINNTITQKFNSDFAGEAALQYATFKANINKTTRVLELWMVITDIATGKTVSMNETIEG